MIVLFSRSSRILKPNQSYKASHGEPLSDTKNRTVIAGQKLTKMRSKKKIVINPELSPFEKIREQNITEIIKASHGEPLSENKSDTKNRTVIDGQKWFKTPSKKKIVINAELSPYEKIREQNIAERMALLVKLGFCEEKKELKIKAKTVKKRESPMKSTRKSERVKNAGNSV